MDLALVRRTVPKVPHIGRRIMAECQAELPLYAMLPQEEIDGEMLDIVLENVRLYLNGISDGEPPTDGELASIRASAALRAEERIPLADVLSAYHIGARVVWQTLVETARPDDSADLLAAGTYAFNYLQAVVGAIAGAFVEVQQTAFGEERQARQALYAALLENEAAADLAERAGVPLARSYAVLALDVALPESDESDAGSAVAARRRIRWTQAELDAYAHTPVLGTFDGRRGIALLPAPAECADSLVDAIAARLGAPVFAALSDIVEPVRLSAAVQETVEVADLARALGLPHRLYRLDDLLLEHQLARPGPARARLAGRLDKLTDHPYLLETLRAHVKHGADRQQTAADLHVHPNTLDYRLRRAAQLTGLDPTRPADARIIAAALLIRQLDGTPEPSRG